jgi:hypothetical protein
MLSALSSSGTAFSPPVSLPVAAASTKQPVPVSTPKP